MTKGSVSLMQIIQCFGPPTVCNYAAKTSPITIRMIVSLWRILVSTHSPLWFFSIPIYFPFSFPGGITHIRELLTHYRVNVFKERKWCTIGHREIDSSAVIDDLLWRILGNDAHCCISAKPADVTRLVILQCQKNSVYKVDVFDASLFLMYFDRSFCNLTCLKMFPPYWISSCVNINCK